MSKRIPGEWAIGPIERDIAPPMQTSITVYRDLSPLVMYVGVSAFTDARIEDKELQITARQAAAAPALLDALQKVSAYLDDLSKSNPGYLGKLVIQDYAQFNEAMIAMQRAIAKATGAEMFPSHRRTPRLTK